MTKYLIPYTYTALNAEHLPKVGISSCVIEADKITRDVIYNVAKDLTKDFEEKDHTNVNIGILGWYKFDE